MGFEGQPPSALEGVSASFVESLYRQYSANPASVDPEWQRHFAGLESVASGPSWQRKGWPDTATDDLTAALDPLQMTPEPKAAAAKKGGGAATLSAEAVRQAADDAIRAMTLIRTYRVRGHLAAQLDPLGLAERPGAGHVGFLRTLQCGARLVVGRLRGNDRGVRPVAAFAAASRRAALAARMASGEPTSVVWGINAAARVRPTRSTH